MTQSNAAELAELGRPFPDMAPGSCLGECFDLSEVEVALTPFLHWAEPYIRADRLRVIAEIRALAQRCPDRLLAGQLVASVNSAFARPVLALCQRTLVLELGLARHRQQLHGNTSRERFGEFVEFLASEAGHAHICRCYPLLLDAIQRCVSLTAENLVELLGRVVADGKRLDGLSGGKSGLGRLLSFKTEMGDRHINGRSVARLDFEHGRVFYKPRSLAIDVAFGELLSRLCASGIGPDQRAPSALNCGDYGYVAEVAYQEAASDQDLRDYYRRFGGLIAICHILGTTDLHHENVIASGSYPVIIDTETLLQPSHAGRRGKRARRHVFADTVLYSGLLPHGDAGSVQNDLSALFMPHESLYSRVPTGAGTDELKLEVVQVAMPFAANMARLRGKVAEPDRYVDAIEAGFVETYRGLLSAKAMLLDESGPLAPLKSMEVRTILRPTQVYGYLIAALSHPDYLRSTDKREALIARIRPGRDGWLTYRRVWLAERLALLRGDVPYFSCRVDGRDLIDDCGKVVPRVFGSSAWAESQRRISALSERDLERQRRMLREAVICTRPPQRAALWNDLFPTHAHPQPMAHVPSEQLLCEAIRIGDRVMAAGFEQSGHVNHFQLALRGQQALRPFHNGPELYDGLAGMALFYGELARQSGQKRFLRACETALASARREMTHYGRMPESIGGYSGLAGWIYVLALLAQRLDRAAWLDEAMAWLPKLAERIAHDKMLDVIGGSAGALLVLCELERVAPGRGVLAVAQQCAEHLAAAAISDVAGARWLCQSYPDAPITGFSHGTAGIAAALARFAEVSGEGRYRALALEAIRFERSSYGDSGWRDLRHAHCDQHGDASHQYAWCHGAPGIGLGRMALPPSMHDASWRVDMENSIRHTAEHGLVGGHCLCHGQLGNLELLMAFDLRYPGQALAGDWRSHLARIVEEGRQLWRTGSVEGHDLLGMMTGLTGIGYALLRAAAPAEVPSVLLLELA